MKVNQIKAGSVLAYLQMAAGIVIGLLYTPLMIRCLGTSEYGLYNTVSSTIAMLSILSLGFNSGYIRYYAKYKKNNDTDSISRLNGMFLLIFAVIGLIALVCGLFLTFHLDLVFKDGLTADEMAIARVLMLLLTVNLTLSFPMSVFTNIISAHERFVFLKLLGVCKTVLGPLVSVPLLLAGCRSIALVAVTVTISLVTDLIYLYFVLRVLKCRFLFSHFEKGLLWSLFIYTSFIAINMIVDQINWNIDKILLTRFKGTLSVAIYSAGYTLYTYYMMLSTSISGLFTPRIHRIVTTTEHDTTLRRSQLSDLFIRVGRIQYMIIGTVACGFVFFGKTFVAFWAGSEYGDAYLVALLLMLSASVALIQNTGIEIQRAQNKHKFRSIAYSVMAIINLVLSIYLCQLYGAIGSAVGTAISLVVCNGIIMNIYYHQKCNLDVPAFWKSILLVSRGFVLPILTGVLLNYLMPADTVLLYLLKMLLFVTVCAVSVVLFGMNRDERDMFKKFIQRILPIKKGKKT